MLVVTTDLLPYCPLLLDKKYKYKKKESNPKLNAWEKTKQYRRSNAEFEKEANAAKSKMHDTKPKEDQDVVDAKKQSNEPLENDCITKDSTSPQSIALSRRFAKLYILLLKWFKCRFTVFCMWFLNSNHISCRGSSLQRSLWNERRRGCFSST